MPYAPEKTEAVKCVALSGEDTHPSCDAPAHPAGAMIHPLPLERSSLLFHLRHYSTRLRHSHRLRYRIARLLVILLPLVVFLYTLKLAH